MKKIMALFLSFVLLLTSLSTLLANVQLAVDDMNIDNVYYVIGENIVTGDPLINPTISISWTDPTQWADDIDIHDPSEYRVTVDNHTLSTENTIVLNEGSTAFTDHALDIHNEINLETGSFYEITIHPYHYHSSEVGGFVTLTEAPTVEAPEVGWAITDLQVDFESSEDSIQVIWDDLGIAEFDYRIIYALGDYTGKTKQELLNNAEGEITGLTMDSDDVDAFYDPIEQRDKLSYIIDENIYPGQVYSVLVEPTADYYNGQIIVRNRNYPFIQSISTSVNLSLLEEGDYLRLQWEIPSSFKVGQDKDQYALVEGTLLQYQDGQGSNLVIFDGDAASIGYYRIQKPIWETEYELKLVYKAVDDTSKPDIEPISNRLTYVPSEYLIQPTKPYVPKVLNDTILEDLRETYTLEEVQDILEEDYLVPGDSYTDPLDDLFDANITFHTDSVYNGINLVWGAFRRIDVDATSSTYGESITDTNVYYDIWVTKELSALSYATAALSDARYTSTTSNNVILDSSSDIIGYQEALSFYYDAELGEMKTITPGDLYYVKVRAKKVTSQGTLYSEPTITSIYFNYDGASFEPPTISKPPLHVVESETSEDGITLEWNETWYEVISADAVSPEPLASWQHQVWVDKTTGEVFIESKDNTEYFALYESEAEIERFKDYLLTFGDTSTIVDRYVTLGLDEFGVSDVKYKFYYVPYEYVLAVINERQKTDVDFGFEDYYNEIIQNDQDETDPISWNEIIPTVDGDNSELLFYRQEGLLENTSYLFLLMPYRVLSDDTFLNSHYPTPIVASTDPIEDEVIPDPTVPSLYTIDPTDMTITTTWKYNLDFEYEIMYNIEEDIDTAEAFDYTLPENILDPNYPEDGKYFEVIVDDLFPLTTYYFWVRATQTSTGQSSSWSNPAIGNTLDTDSPIPPRGVGLPPLSRIEPYDYEASVTEEYIMIEWIKDLDDVDVESDAKVQKSISYVVEIADNAKFIDPIYVESSGGLYDIIPGDVEILEKNMIKVNGLVSNRNYYVRALTRVRVEGSLDGQLLIKDSISYSEPLRIITLSTGTEYDGDDDPALSVLPDKDYELIYDSVDDLLVFRFRDDSTDESGAADNNVDQRLISDLIADGIYEYEIDVNGYEGKAVDSRRVIIPYSILEAFDTHQVDMKILAGEMTVEVPSDAIIDRVKDQVKAYGVAPQVVIDIEELEVGHTLSLIPQDSLLSVATPQKLDVEVRSQRKTDVVGYTDEEMTIGLKTNSRYEVYDKDVVLYVQDSKAKWHTNEGTYDQPQGMMMFDTADVGSYGLYVEDHSGDVNSNTNPNHWSEGYRQDVFSQKTVTGLGAYNPDAKVSEKNVVQAVYGTAMSDTTIDLSESLTSKDMTTVQRSGLKNDTDQSDGTISREEALAMFVRAYEILNETVVTLDQGTYNTVVSNSAVSSTYKTDIAKAYSLGFVTDLNAIRPQDSMSYAEFFTVWSRALE